MRALTMQKTRERTPETKGTGTAVARLDVEIVRPTGKQMQKTMDGLDLVFELAARRCRRCRQADPMEPLDLCRE